MIIRIVKLTLKLDKLEEFKAIFEGSKEKIRGFDGCNHLELLQDANNPQIFMTYSFWNAQSDLENYRHSDLFKSVWANTKVLFDGKPEAWSMNQLHKLV